MVFKYLSLIFSIVLYYGGLTPFPLVAEEQKKALNDNLERFYLEKFWDSGDSLSRITQKKLLEKARDFGGEYSDTWYFLSLYENDSPDTLTKRADYLKKAIELKNWYYNVLYKAERAHIQLLFRLERYKEIVSKYRHFIDQDLENEINVSMFILASMYEVGNIELADQFAERLLFQEKGELGIALVVAKYRSEFAFPLGDFVTQYSWSDVWSENWLAGHIATMINTTFAQKMLQEWEEKWGADSYLHTLAVIHDLDWEYHFNALLKEDPVELWDLLVAVKNTLDPELIPIFEDWLAQYSGIFYGSTTLDGQRYYRVGVRQGIIESIDYQKYPQKLYFSLKDKTLIVTEGKKESIIEYSEYPIVLKYQLSQYNRQRFYDITLNQFSLPILNRKNWLSSMDTLAEFKVPDESIFLANAYLSDEYIDGYLVIRYHLNRGSPFLLEGDPLKQGYFTHQWRMRNWEPIAGRIDTDSDGLYNLYEHYTNGKQDGIAYVDHHNNLEEYKSSWGIPWIQTWSIGRDEYLEAWQINDTNGRKSQYFQSLETFDTILPWNWQDVEAAFSFASDNE